MLCSLYNRADSNQNSLLFEIRKSIPPDRLKSRNSPWHRFMENFSIDEKWRSVWQSNIPKNGFLISDPCKQLDGFDLHRHEWSKLIRFKSCHGHCKYLLSIEIS